MQPSSTQPPRPPQDWIDKISDIERTADAAWHLGGEAHMRLTLEDVANRLSGLLASISPADEGSKAGLLASRTGCTAGKEEECTHRACARACPALKAVTASR